MKNEILDHLITTTILKPQYRKYNTEGAPFEIGCKVKILDGSADSTFDKKYSNKTGWVDFLEYDCGCGQTYPSDPMIGVKFINGEIEEFWKEELTKI
jgi:hypothetical protein